jgi:hypothetical protein
MVVEAGSQFHSNYPYAYGYLVGSVKSVIIYGNVSNTEFEVLVEALVASLDPYLKYNLEFFESLKEIAKKRGINLEIKLPPSM